MNIILTNIILTIISLSFISTVSGQVNSESVSERNITPITLPTNIERYGIDYKLEDESVIASDSSILNMIDLESLEPMRSEVQNVTVQDSVTSLDVILFHERKSKRSNVLLNTIEQ